MKKTILFILLWSLPFVLRAQEFATEDIHDYGRSKNDAEHPCISAADYATLNRECAENLKRLGLDVNLNRNALTTSLLWPLKPAAGFSDCGYHFIGAYVDQNTAAGTFSDYNCETNTYDGHHGTDIAIWPYGFYKMDYSQIEVVAAAAGTIIQKADGNFDRNCSANNLTANSIIIQHADGTYALYWHMKKNSVTSKTVGQTVTAGEYLGVVGSSGSASGPHLHFEIWTGTTNDTYKDPFSGPCNTLNANSWWTAQKPHTDPKVIKVSVNTTDIVLPGCPNTETPNESDSYTIPFQGAGLPAGYAKFYVFLRDDTAGLTGDCKILNPNGSTFNSWSFTSASNNKTYIRGYSKLLPTNPGIYTFQVTYNGVSCSKSFEILNPLVSATFEKADIRIYPNPVKDVFEITGIIDGDYTMTISNLAGQTIRKENITSGNHLLSKSFSTFGLSAGIYLISVSNESVRTVTKMIKR